MIKLLIPQQIVCKMSYIFTNNFRMNHLTILGGQARSHEGNVEDKSFLVNRNF